MILPRPGRMQSSWVAYSVGLVLFAGVLAFLLASHRQESVSQQATHLEALARIVERNLSNQLEQVNRALEALLEDSSTAVEDLRHLTQALSGVNGLMLVDESGRVAASAQAADLGVDLSGTEDFREAKAGGAGTALQVSSATNQTETATLAVVKALRDDRGDFKGLARVVLSISYFRDVMESVRYRPELSVRLNLGGAELFLEGTGVPTGSTRPLIVLRNVTPAGLQLGKPWTVEIGLHYEAFLGPVDQAEMLAWLLYLVAAGGLGSLLFLLGSGNTRHAKQESQYFQLLQNSALRFQLAAEAAHLGVWEWEPGEGILSWDRQMFRLYGRDESNAALTLDQWFGFLLPEDREQAEAMLRQSFESRQACHLLFRIVRADGSHRWIQCNSRFYGSTEETAERFIGVSEDITQRVQSATSLMERERFLRLVTETTHSMIAYYSADEVCRFTNSHYARRHGFLAEELVGMALRDVLGSQLYRKRTEVIQKVLAGQPQELQTAAFDVDENESFLWIHYEPDVQEGVAHGFFIIVDDITELKKARDQLEAQQGKLILSARMAQMGELLNLISHQWRQPLTVISALVGNIQLRSQLGNLDTDYLLPKLDKVTQTVQTMSNTIESFRTFFSPSKVPGRTDLIDMTRKALEILSPVLQKSGLEVRVEAPEQPLWANVLQSELMQVVIEVLGNARQALSRTSAPGWIKIEWEALAGSATLTISNNGGAISPEVLPKIFEPYFSTRNDGTGTGMGLYMAKVIVEGHHHGTLQVSCDADITSFRISLPLEESAP